MKLLFDPGFEWPDSTYYAKLAIEYDTYIGSDEFTIEERPLQFRIDNQCKPSKVRLKNDANESG